LTQPAGYDFKRSMLLFMNLFFMKRDIQTMSDESDQAFKGNSICNSAP